MKLENSNMPSKADLEFLSSIDLTSPYNQYVSSFYSFMNFYSYLIYGDNYVISDSVQLLFNDLSQSTRMFEAALKTDLTEDNFLAFATAQTISDIGLVRDRRKGRLEYLDSIYGPESSVVKYLVAVDSELAQYNLKSGDTAPSFYLEDLNKDLHSLQDHRGRIVLLNFYTPGCVACKKEVPYERELQAKYEDNFQIINVCMTDSKESFQKTYSKFQLEGINVFTPGSWMKKLRDKYMINGYPHYVLVDRDGNIVKNHAFKPISKKLEPLIESIL